MSGLTRTSPARYVWLLELDLGHVYRFCTETIDVERTASGGVTTTHRYEQGLETPDVSLFIASRREEVTQEVSLLAAVYWAELVARGVPLEGRWATLLRHEVNSLYETARVVLRGRIAQASYGGPFEPLSITLRRSLLESTTTWPPVQAVIDSKTWPVDTPNFILPDDSDGHAYPIIVGSPGYNASGDAHPALQAYYAQYYGAGPASSYIVVGDGTIAASTVHLTVRDEENATPVMGSPQDLGVSQVEDLLGRTVSVVSHPGSGGGIILAVRFFVGFNAAAGSGVTDRRGDPIRGAGSVLRWLLEEHVDYRVDWGRFIAVEQILDAYKVDTFINESVNLWEWFTDEVLPMLPIELRESTEGLYPFLWRFDATKRDAVAHLDANPENGRVSRSSQVTTEGTEIYNEITIEYGPSSDGSSFRFRKVATSQARTTAVAGASPSDDDRIRASGLLLDSQGVFGVRQLTLQLAAVWDHQTAELVLRHKVLQHGWPRRRVSYQGGDWLETLRQGDVVTLTDPELLLTDEVALVLDVTPSGDAIEVELLILDHPRQRRRLTG